MYNAKGTPIKLAVGWPSRLWPVTISGSIAPKSFAFTPLDGPAALL
jgi:hypothetical protein